MFYAQLDHIADSVNIVLALAVIAGALWLQRAAAWRFLLIAFVATALVQQSAKLVQHLGWLGHKFPSTHFAVALCLATFLVVLHRKLLWPAVAVVVFYGALMLYQKYHTPVEMLGAFYAVPVAYAFGMWSRAAKRDSGRDARAASGQN